MLLWTLSFCKEHLSERLLEAGYTVDSLPGQGGVKPPKKKEVKEMKKIVIYMLLSCTLISGCNKQETNSDTQIGKTSIQPTGSREPAQEEMINSIKGNYLYTSLNCVYFNMELDIDGGYYHSELSGKGMKQFSFRDGSVKDVKIDHFLDVLYVNDKWIYYSAYFDDPDAGEELYRVPIHQKNGKEEVELSKRERLLVEKDGFFEGEFGCVKDYLVYVTRSHEYRKFNLKNRKFVKVEDIHINCSSAGEPNLMNSIWDNKVFLNCKSKLYAQDLDSKKMTFVDNHCGSFVTNGEKAFFIHLKSKTKEESIKLLDEKNETKTFLSLGVILNTMNNVEVKTLSDYTIDKLFIYDKKMYMLIIGVKDGVKTVLSCDIEKTSDLKVEEELTTCLAKNHVVMHDMVDDYMLMYDGKDIFSGVYNLKTNSYKLVVEKDKEWYLRYVNTKDE